MPDVEVIVVQKDKCVLNNWASRHQPGGQTTRGNLNEEQKMTYSPPHRAMCVFNILAILLLVAAALVPGSRVTIEGVNINPTRTGLLDVLSRMGAEIALAGEQIQNNEPCADLIVQSSHLVATQVSGDTVHRGDTVDRCKYEA